MTANPGTLVYDGDCAFCTTCARWVSGRWAGPYRAASWQDLGPEGLARLGLTEADARAAAWWVAPGGRRRRGHRAVAAALAQVPGPWGAVGRALGLPPLSWFGAGAYPLVVRYRHRLPGAGERCRVPSAGGAR